MEVKQIKTILWALGIFLMLMIIFLPGYTKLQELRDRNQYLEQRIKKINSENLSLNKEVELLRSDPLYQEKIAREKMGLVRKGEVIYQIEPEE